MSSTLYNVAVSGMQSAQVGLTTTGNNLANVNTAGYTRQQVVQSASAPAFSGAGFVGTGTNVETVRRVYTGVLSNQAIAAQASASEYAARSEVSSALATSIGDPTTSVAATMDGFFAAASQLASNPSDSAARTGFLLSADAVAGRFRSMQEQLDTARSGAADRISADVDQANSLAKQIAAVNDAIAGSSGSGHTPNDLFDKRDALLGDLNKLVRATSVTRSDGTVDVALSNGQSLVLPGLVNKLGVKGNPQDPRSLQVGIVEGGEVRALGNPSSLGGEIGGLIGFRDNELAQAQSDLGALAANFAAVVNAEHKKGFDTSGVAGGALFSFDTLRPAGAASNKGSAVLNASAGDGSALAASDYRLEVKAGGVTVTRLSDGQSSDFGSLPASIDGISFSLKSGSAAVGDSFTLSSSQGLAGNIRTAFTDPRRIAAAGRSPAASGDNTTLLAIADLQTRALGDGSTLVQKNAQMVSRAAERSGELATESAVRARLLDDATSARESASGVNLDEEAANLMRYQQAYQASGRVIAVANTLFDTLLSLGR